jgi:hypothetical protein
VSSLKSAGGATVTPTPTPTVPGATAFAPPGMPRQGAGDNGQGVILGDTSWLANLATGDASAAATTSRRMAMIPAAPLALFLLQLIL